MCNTVLEGETNFYFDIACHYLLVVVVLERRLFGMAIGSCIFDIKIFGSPGKDVFSLEKD